jgi:hypothetical protein
LAILIQTSAAGAKRPFKNVVEALRIESTVGSAGYTENYAMTMRSRRETICFKHPFRLKGIDRELAPGSYEIVTDEEMIEGLIICVLSACRDHDHDPCSGSASDVDGNDHDQFGRSLRSAAHGRERCWCVSRQSTSTNIGEWRRRRQPISGASRRRRSQC